MPAHETTSPPWSPLRTLGHRLDALGMHLRRQHPRSADAALVLEAAVEIMRLRGVVRVNAMRRGATHAEVDAVLYPEDGKR